MTDLISLLNTKYFTSLSYNTLKELETGKAVINEAVSHWEQTGFLSFVKNDDKKAEIAIAFDNAAHDFMCEDKTIVSLSKRYNFNFVRPENEPGNIDFSIIVFPLILKVVNEVDNFDYKKFIEMLKELSFFAINYDGYEYDADIEAEAISVLASTIIDRFKNKLKEAIKNNK